MRRRDLLAGVVGLSSLGFAQNASFTTGVDVVNVFAAVRDRQGRYVHDLAQSDFELREDSRPQQIRYFSRQTDAALTIGMLVDTSMSQRLVLETEQNAGKAFFWQVLRPTQDAAFVIRFDIEVEMTQSLTTSHQDLDRALDSLELPRANGRSGGAAARGIGTLLHDAVVLAAEDVLERQEGRKTIILLSDGVDYGSQHSLDKAIEAAQKADAAVYSIRIADPGTPRRGLGLGLSRRSRVARRIANGDDVLRQMAEETGGRYFEISEKRGLGDVYREIDEELRNQYSLGYASDNTKRDGEFRKIEVRTKRKGLIVQARAGYYAPG